MYTRNLRQLLLTTTALTVIAVATPAISQSNSNNQYNRVQTENQNQFGNNQNEQQSNQYRQNNRSSNNSNMQSTFSDQQNFSKIRAAAANDIVGQTLGSSDGGSSGDIEYMLIEPYSGKVMYVLVGMGGMMTVDQDLAIVPFEAIEVERDDDESLNLTLRASSDRLKQAPTLSDSELQNLTSPRMQMAVTNFWQPMSGDSGQAQNQSGSSWSDNQNMTNRSQSSSNNQGNQQSQRAQQNQGTMGSNRSQNNQMTNDQSGNTANMRSNADADQNRRNRNMAGADQSQNQRTGQDGKVYTLVGRSYISALAPPAVMQPDQIRGASIVDQGGEELGEIDRLIVDLDRGYVAYAMVSQGEFLGLGGTVYPVPINALRWQQGETFALNMNKDQMANMPSLKNNDLPADIRRRHLDRLYQSYNVRPYWELAQSMDGQDGQSGMGQASRSRGGNSMNQSSNRNMGDNSGTGRSMNNAQGQMNRERNTN